MSGRVSRGVWIVVAAGVVMATLLAMVAMQSFSNESEARSTAVVRVPLELKVRSEPSDEMYYYVSSKSGKQYFRDTVICKTGGTLSVPTCREGNTYRKNVTRPYGKRVSYSFGIVSSECMDSVGGFRSAGPRTSCAAYGFDRNSRVAKSGAVVRGYYDRGPDFGQF